jgi:hypothetical protein
MDKRTLGERDNCTKFIAPALRRAGWDDRMKALTAKDAQYGFGRLIDLARARPGEAWPLQKGRRDPLGARV